MAKDQDQECVVGEQEKENEQTQQSTSVEDGFDCIELSNDGGKFVLRHFCFGC